jgi:hypothetical protein
MGKKKRGNYNQDHFKLGGSIQPGGDIVQERQKGKLTQQKKSSEPMHTPQTRDPRPQSPDPRTATEN